MSFKWCGWERIYISVNYLDVLMTHQGNCSTGNVHQNLKLKVSSWSVGDYCLQSVNFIDQKLIDMFFDLSTIIFISVSFQGIEKSLIYQNSKLISVIELFDLLDKKHKLFIGLNYKIVALITQFVISVGFFGQEATCQSKLYRPVKV